MSSDSDIRVLVVGDGNRASVQVEDFARALVAAGIRPVFATLPPGGEFHARMAELGFKAHGLGLRSAADYPLVCVRLARIARAERTQLIHAVEAIPAGVSAVATLPTKDIRCVYHQQITESVWPRTAFDFVANRRSDLVIACSDACARAAFHDDHVPQSRIRMVYNGVAEPREVSPAEVAFLRARLGIPPDAYVLSTVARLREEKGIQIALAALGRVAQDIARPVHYVIAGEGPYGARLQAAAARSVVPIHFVGHQRDVPPWFQLADLVLMPSFREGLPLAAAEAMACSRPIVGSRVDGLTEAIANDVTGIIVEPHDPVELAAATIELLADPERRERMGAAAYQRFRNFFTLDAMVYGLLDCWRGLVNARGR